MADPAQQRWARRRASMLNDIELNRRRLRVLSARTTTPGILARIDEAAQWNQRIEADLPVELPSGARIERLVDRLAWQLDVTGALISEVDAEQGQLT